MIRRLLVIILLSIIHSVAVPTPGKAGRSPRFFISESTISFLSEAPLERIEAISHELKGVLEPDSRSLAFSVVNRSFKGFNSALQREHFNESYMESEKFPYCTFVGKIVDEVNFYREGVFQVRVKGILTLKGVAREQIVKGSLEVDKEKIRIKCSFPVSLADHQIRVPKLVYQKIAPVIQVSLKATMVEGEEP